MKRRSAIGTAGECKVKAGSEALAAHSCNPPGVTALVDSRCVFVKCCGQNETQERSIERRFISHQECKPTKPQVTVSLLWTNVHRIHMMGGRVGDSSAAIFGKINVFIIVKIAKRAGDGVGGLVVHVRVNCRQAGRPTPGERLRMDGRTTALPTVAHSETVKA